MFWLSTCTAAKADMEFLKVFGCHISFDRISTATWVYKPDEKLTYGCFQI